jgi:hypothetical protein
MYDEYKSQNFWKSKHKLDKIESLIARMRADADIKSARIDNLIDSIKIINNKLNDSIQFINPFILTNSFIVVNGNNPEGKEINDIPGVGNAVEIFSDNVSIGFTGSNVISINSGYHLIKVEFNGMSLEQAIDIKAGETRYLIFTFTRILYDLWSKIPESESKTVHIDGVSYGIQSLVEDDKQLFIYGQHVGTLFEDPYDGGFDEEGIYIKSSWSYAGDADLTWTKGINSITFESHSSYSLVHLSNEPGRPLLTPYAGSWAATGSYGINLDMFNNSINNWYLQYSNSSVGGIQLILNSIDLLYSTGINILSVIPAINQLMLLKIQDVQTAVGEPPSHLIGGGNVDLTHCSSVPYAPEDL